MNLCLPAHQHHLLQFGITTVFATISTSFNFSFSLHLSFLGFSFYSHLLLQCGLSEKVLIYHFWKSFWRCDFFFRRNHPADFNWLNSIIVEVLKMLKVKTYFQFLLLLPVRVEGKKRKNRKKKKSLKFSIN